MNKSFGSGFRLTGTGPKPHEKKPDLFSFSIYLLMQKSKYLIYY